MVAEGATFERLQELGESLGPVVERAAIQAAADELLMIKTGYLSRPPVSPCGNQRTRSLADSLSG